MTKAFKFICFYYEKLFVVNKVLINQTISKLILIFKTIDNINAKHIVNGLIH